VHFFNSLNETLKSVNAQQTKPYNIYKSTKLKLLKTKTAICFNIICRDCQLQPKYEGWKFNSGNYLFKTDTK